MKKSLAMLAGLVVAVSLNAGTIVCDYPVSSSEPIYKTVVKKIPTKECWDEQLTSNVCKSSYNTCSTDGVIVAKTCTVTKCKTVWNTYEEKVVVGYRNYAEVCGKTISKVSGSKLKTIRITSTY